MIQASQPLTPRQQAIYDLFVTGDASLIQFSRTSRRLYDWYKRGIEGLSKPVGCTIEAAAWLAGRDTTARKAQATPPGDIAAAVTHVEGLLFEAADRNDGLRLLAAKDAITTILSAFSTANARAAAAEERETTLLAERDAAREIVRRLVDASPALIVKAIRAPDDEAGLEDWTSAATAARAFLATSREGCQPAGGRVKALEEALREMRGILRSLQPAMNVMAREVMDDIIREQIDALLSPQTAPAEQKEG